MKTLLISLQSNTDTIGLKYLHSYLIQNKIDSSLLFVPKYNQESSKQINSFLRNYNPKIIGISLMSDEFSKARELTKSIKQEFPEIKIVWGGVEPSIDPENCLNYADYVFVGESEYPFLEFIKKLEKNEVKDIPNLSYKFKGKVIKN